MKQGRFVGAEVFLREQLMGCGNVLGFYHPTTLECASIIGLVFQRVITGLQ